MQIKCSASRHGLDQAAISFEERERAVTVGSAPAEATVGNAESVFGAKQHCARRDGTRSTRTLFAWQVVAVSGPLLQLRAFLPELPGYHQWIELPVLPPLPLVSDCVVLMMMDSAQRHGEFVANFEPHSSRLREAHMVRMRGLAPTDRAGLPGNVLQMLLRPALCPF